MKVRLKKLRDQVVVITGASSGIGLTTARMAARRGARLVLAARSEGPIRELTEEIREAGGDARYIVADVNREEDVRRVAAEAVGHFGRFDTWVNNAGVSIYGPVLETSIQDARKLFETNFWGLVYGSRVAAEHLRHEGGALINLGSVVSDRAVPLQGFYSASKHAVKGFTDALRMELEHEGAPVSVTLIKPTSIDTPYTKHAKNYMDEEPDLPAPVYHPKLVAEAILKAAEKPVRDIFVGGGAKMTASMESISPRATDLYLGATAFTGSKSGRPAEGNRESGLYSGSGAGEETGPHEGMVIRRDPYHEAIMHPLAAGLLGIGASIAIGTLLKGRTRSNT